MRVISQEGFCYQDIPYEYSAFYMSTSGTHIYANCNGVVYSLAEYSTVEKAEKAMQKLHECYTGVILLQNVGFPDDAAKQLKSMKNGFICVNNQADNVRIEPLHTVFRFPQEDEI